MWQAVLRIDNTHSEYEGKLYASTSTTLTDGSTQGHYTVNNGQNSQTYADVLININKRIQDFTIVANIGASYSGITSKELGYAGPIRETGIPNLFNVYDLDNAKKRAHRPVGVKRRNLSLPVRRLVGRVCFTSL